MLAGSVYASEETVQVWDDTNSKIAPKKLSELTARRAPELTDGQKPDDLVTVWDFALEKITQKTRGKLVTKRGQNTTPYQPLVVDSVDIWNSSEVETLGDQQNSQNY